jgi:hypothetical protein
MDQNDICPLIFSVDFTFKISLICETLSMLNMPEESHDYYYPNIPTEDSLQTSVYKQLRLLGQLGGT